MKSDFTNDTVPLPSDEAQLPLFPRDQWIGDLTLLTRPTATVLNSRQGKYPVGEEPWVQNTVKAVEYCARQGWTVLTGIGMKTWELVLWAAAESMAEVVVLVGVSPKLSEYQVQTDVRELFHNFHIDESNALAIPYKETRQKKSLWLQRDTWILDNSKVLLPVSVRCGGFMDTRLSDKEFSGKMDNRFRVDYNPRKLDFTASFDFQAIQKLPDDGKTWAIHWTRTSQGPWPGETPSDYYTALVEGGDTYPRTAEETLKRILAEKKIRGTCWRMPMKKAMVSLSILEPSYMHARMKWSQRYVRPTFEPFGIGIECSALQNAGGKPVVYGASEELKGLSIEDRLFFQTVHDQGENWAEEKEWRVLGDLDLTTFSEDQVVVYVPAEDVEKRISVCTPFSVMSLTGTTSG